MSDANHTSILGEMPPTTPPPKRENALFDGTTTSCHPRSRVRIDFPPLSPVIMYNRAMPPPGQPGTYAGLSKPLPKPTEGQEWARDASTREWKLVPTTTASPQRDDAPREFALIFPPSPQQKLFHLRSDSTSGPFNISFSPDPTACHHCPHTTIGTDINNITYSLRSWLSPRQSILFGAKRLRGATRCRRIRLLNEADGLE